MIILLTRITEIKRKSKSLLFAFKTYLLRTKKSKSNNKNGKQTAIALKKFSPMFRHNFNQLWFSMIMMLTRINRHYLSTIMCTNLMEKKIILKRNTIKIDKA